MQVDTPVDAFELEQVAYALPEPVLVAVKVGTTPPTATLLASFRVIVTLDTATPFATTGPVLVMVE